MADSSLIDRRAAAPDTGVLSRTIRAARHERGVTLAELAAATALDKGYLSRVERNLKAPSIATVLKIAKALDVPVAQLFGETVDDNVIHVSRHRERSEHAAHGESNYRIEGLTHGKGSDGLEGFLLFPPDSFVEDLRAEHHGEELLFVVEGPIEVKFADRTIRLDTGDSVQFPGNLVHYVRRLGPTGCVLVTVSRR
jgi:transcriptional regulator with XRE-family HTH domain